MPLHLPSALPGSGERTPSCVSSIRYLRWNCSLLHLPRRPGPLLLSVDSEWSLRSLSFTGPFHLVAFLWLLSCGSPSPSCHPPLPGSQPVCHSVLPLFHFVFPLSAVFPTHPPTHCAFSHFRPAAPSQTKPLPLPPPHPHCRSFNSAPHSRVCVSDIFHHFDHNTVIIHDDDNDTITLTCPVASRPSTSVLDPSSKSRTNHLGPLQHRRRVIGFRRPTTDWNKGNVQPLVTSSTINKEYQGIHRQREQQETRRRASITRYQQPIDVRFIRTIRHSTQHAGG